MNNAQDEMKLEIQGNGAAFLRIAGTQGRGSFTPKMIDDFDRSIAQVRGDSSIKVLTLIGNGRYFSTGADFGALAESVTGEIRDEESQARFILEKIYLRFFELWKLEIPTIAAMNGHAVGGGLGVAMFCDLRIACPEAKMGANFPRLGFAPGMGISYLLPLYTGLSRGQDLLFTGRLITGDEALRLGLVHECVPKDKVEEKATEIANQLAAGAPLAIKAVKRLIRANHMGGLTKALEMESREQARTFTTRDAMEGISAMMGKREPKFEGK